MGGYLRIAIYPGGSIFALNGQEEPVPSLRWMVKRNRCCLCAEWSRGTFFHCYKSRHVASGRILTHAVRDLLMRNHIILKKNCWMLLVDSQRPRIPFLIFCVLKVHIEKIISRHLLPSDLKPDYHFWIGLRIPVRTGFQLSVLNWISLCYFGNWLILPMDTCECVGRFALSPCISRLIRPVFAWFLGCPLFLIAGVLVIHGLTCVVSWIVWYRCVSCDFPELSF